MEWERRACEDEGWLEHGGRSLQEGAQKQTELLGKRRWEAAEDLGAERRREVYPRARVLISPVGLAMQEKL